ncbi:MAG: hypothetical protein ACRYE7_00190 [Janthinobacterium lividum]
MYHYIFIHLKKGCWFIQYTETHFLILRFLTTKKKKKKKTFESRRVGIFNRHKQSINRTKLEFLTSNEVHGTASI